MRRREPGLEPELEAFLERRKIERTLPPRMRARVLARARTVIATGGAVPSSRNEPLASAPYSAGRRRISGRVALALSAAFAAGALATIVGLHRRAAPPLPGPPAATVTEKPIVPARSPPHPADHVSELATDQWVLPPRRVRPAGFARDPFVQEQEILQRAQAAYARRRFSTALVALAEHARRFPDGHLAEEREALRVRSLLALGRRDDARSAATAFAARFPRSVLLPRVESEASAPP